MAQFRKGDEESHGKLTSRRNGKVVRLFVIVISSRPIHYADENRRRNMVTLDIVIRRLTQCKFNKNVARRFSEKKNIFN